MNTVLIEKRAAKTKRLLTTDEASEYLNLSAGTFETGDPKDEDRRL